MGACPVTAPFTLHGARRGRRGQTRAGLGREKAVETECPAQTGHTTRHTLSSQPDCHQRGVPGSPSHRQEDEHDAQARNRGDGGPGADPGSM